MKGKRLCIAGKGDVACRALDYVLDELGMSGSDIVVVPVESDTGAPSWQPSLRLLAERRNVDVASLEGVYDEEGLVFVSLEFDRIVRTNRFRSSRLYNIHFSVLPKYRGIGMAMWPILNGDEKSGVTLHRIDDGIDTGDVIAQREFALGRDWDCRRLYVKFNDEAFLLFREWIARLLADVCVPARRQVAVGASYYSRSDTNYDVADYAAFFRKTAWQATSALRAATFWEYQLPRVDGRRVMRSRILDARSTRRPGQIERVSKYRSVLSTVDYDVEIVYCAYDDLYDWAAGRRENLSDEAWALIDDIDRRDSHGWSAAMIAAYHCRARCLSELLARGASVNGANYKGTTVLMFAKDGAVNSGDMTCLDVILDAGADLLAKDYRGRTVVDYLKEDARENAEMVMKRLMLAKPYTGGGVCLLIAAPFVRSDGRPARRFPRLLNTSSERLSRRSARWRMFAPQTTSLRKEAA